MNVLNPPPVADLLPEQLRAMRSHLHDEISNQASPVASLRPRRRMIIGTLTAAAAVSVGAYVATTSLGHGAGVSDAAWSPTPTRATSAEFARAESVCRGALSGLTGEPRAAVFARTAPVAVTERRLRSYGIVLSDGHTVATCPLPDPTRREPLASTGGFTGPQTIETSRAVRPAGTGVSLLAGDSQIGDGNGDTGAGSTTFIYGRVGADVRSLVIPLNDGASVTATLSAGGWWEAWYPAGLGSVTQPHGVQVTDSRGIRRTEALT